MGFAVVGLDGSETSRSAFREALREATWRDLEVRAVHVVPHPVALGDGFGSSIDLDLLRRAGARFLSAELDRFEGEGGGRFPVPVSGEVSLGHIGAEIIAAAEGGGDPAELVVLGSRGLGGFRGLLLGSVTTYAVHHLSCRVLIVPAVEDGS
jgi:nucleotide-binding universal stress UspA family protein